VTASLTGTKGFDYADAEGSEVVLFSPAGSINVGNGAGAVPEPATLIIWSLLGTLAITVGWRRRKAA